MWYVPARQNRNGEPSWLARTTEAQRAGNSCQKSTPKPTPRPRWARLGAADQQEVPEAQKPDALCRTNTQRHIRLRRLKRSNQNLPPKRLVHRLRLARIFPGSRSLVRRMSVRLDLRLVRASPKVNRPVGILFDPCVHGGAKRPPLTTKPASFGPITHNIWKNSPDLHLCSLCVLLIRLDEHVFFARMGRKGRERADIQTYQPSRSQHADTGEHGQLRWRHGEGHSQGIQAA